VPAADVKSGHLPGQADFLSQHKGGNCLLTLQEWLERLVRRRRKRAPPSRFVFG
jgi:hypothetical protein